MLYRLFTENKNKTIVLGIVSSHFPGFTVYEGQGYWKGKAEETLIVEIDVPEVPCPVSAPTYQPRDDAQEKAYNKVFDVCNAIKALNGQEAVLVQQIVSDSFTV